MSNLLIGKAAAITGAATGIGRAIALEYLKQGAFVAVNHLGDDASRKQFSSLAEEAQAGTRLIEVAGDISNPETAELLVKETVKAFGKLDVFISNAGVCKFADFLT